MKKLTHLFFTLFALFSLCFAAPAAAQKWEDMSYPEKAGRMMGLADLCIQQARMYIDDERIALIKKRLKNNKEYSRQYTAEVRRNSRFAHGIRNWGYFHAECKKLDEIIEAVAAPLETPKKQELKNKTPLPADSSHVIARDNTPYWAGAGSVLAKVGLCQQQARLFLGDKRITKIKARLGLNSRFQEEYQQFLQDDAHAQKRSSLDAAQCKKLESSLNALNELLHTLNDYDALKKYKALAGAADAKNHAWAIGYAYKYDFQGAADKAAISQCETARQSRGLLKTTAPCTIYLRNNNLAQ